MPEHSIGRLATEVLSQQTQDESELSWVIAIAQRLNPEADHDQLRNIVLRALLELLTNGFVEIRDYSRNREPQTVIWTGPPEDQVTRIADEWDRLGRDPLFPSGEVCWVFNTLSGDRKANTGAITN